MKKLSFTLFTLLLTFFSESSLACRCVSEPTEQLAQSKIILELEVIFVDDNKALLKVNDTLSLKGTFLTSYQNKWFILEGADLKRPPRSNSCALMNRKIEYRVGDVLMFFPYYVPIRNGHFVISNFSYNVEGMCIRSSNLFPKGSKKYNEVIDYLNL